LTKTMKIESPLSKNSLKMYLFRT